MKNFPLCFTCICNELFTDTELVVSYYSYQSSPPVELTEAETEYAVNVIKHIFDSHVVFQYNCTNTIPEQLLENVTTKLNKHLFFCFETLTTDRWFTLCPDLLTGCCNCGCFGS